MLTFSNGGHLVQLVTELPPIPETISNLFLDLETGSGSADLSSLNPWRNCYIAGIAVTWDDMPEAYYLPVGHAPGFEYTGNLPWPEIFAWLVQLFSALHRGNGRWINHNIKYDALVLYTAGGLHLTRITDEGEVVWNFDFVCSIVTAKIINSDMMFEGGYGLDNLSKRWLGEDISKYEDAMAPYKVVRIGGRKRKNLDYSRIAADVEGEYACQDVISNRRLYQYEVFRMPDQCREVWQTEIELTRELIETEIAGLGVNELELHCEKFATLTRINVALQRIAQIVGREIRPHVNKDCYELLCQGYGLPVLAYTKQKGKERQGNPSFDGDTLEKYLSYPQVPTELIQLMIDYREDYKHLTGFIEPYLALNIDGVLHGSYDQCKRTGRMSMKQPNMQQLNKPAKKLIHPRPGCSFLSIDYSQIEFRLIVHYIKDEKAIAAYQADPWTDFHTWVSEICNIPRAAGKTLNFLLGYGGGKEKAMQSLAGVKPLIERVRNQIDRMVSEGIVNNSQIDITFVKLLRQHAEHAYNTYHGQLPGLKRASNLATMTARQHGFVFDLYGRHRHLKREFAHIAFNTVNQASAADLIKERMVAIGKVLRGTPIRMVAQVHDEILYEGPTDVIRDPRTANDLVWLMEHPPILHKLRVPIRAECGISEKDWAEAGSDEVAFRVDAQECGYLQHCKKSK